MARQSRGPQPVAAAERCAPRDLPAGRKGDPCREAPGARSELVSVGWPAAGVEGRAAAASLPSRSPGRCPWLHGGPLVGGFGWWGDEKPRWVEGGPEQAAALSQDRRRDGDCGGECKLNPGSRSVGDDDVQDTCSVECLASTDELADFVEHRLQNEDTGNGPAQPSGAGQAEPHERGGRSHEHEHDRVCRILLALQVRGDRHGQCEGNAHPQPPVQPRSRPKRDHRTSRGDAGVELHHHRQCAGAEL